MNRKMRRANLAQNRKPNPDVSATPSTTSVLPLNTWLKTLAALYQEGQIVEVQQQCLQLLQHYPNASDAHNMLAVAYHAQQDFDNAIPAVEKAIQLNPHSADYFNNYGVFMAYKQNLQKAYDLFTQAVHLNPSHVGAINNAGRTALNLGFFDKTLLYFEKLEAITPSDPNLLVNMGTAYSRKQNYVKAAEYYQKAITINPRSADAYSNLSDAFGRLNQLDKAIEAAQKAIEFDPLMPQGYNNLGTTYQIMGQTEKAIEAYKKCIELSPDDHLYWGNLANSYWNNRDYKIAQETAEHALNIKPDYAEAYNTLGNIYDSQGLAQEALNAYLKASELNPTIPEIHHNLGMIWYKHRSFEEAVRRYQHALSLRPQYYEPLLGLANIYGDQAKRELCLSAYDQAYALKPSKDLLLRRALVPFIFPKNRQEINDYQNNIRTLMNQLCSEGHTIPDPVRNIGMTNFFHTYQGINNKEFYQFICQSYRKICPELNYVASHCKTPYQIQKGNKIRLGFISMYFRDHAVTWAYRGIITFLPRDQIEITLLMLNADPNNVTAELCAQVDHVVTILHTFEDICKALEDHPQDILVYTDIGMGPPTYFSAFARLAPIQVVTTGHPDTTGIDTIDYFLSADGLEAEHAQDHYSEQLVRIPGMYVYYYRPPTPENLLPRSAFGLSDDENIYICPQSFFKIGRDMDQLFVKILQADPKGRLVIMSQDSYWSTHITDRFYDLDPNVISRLTLMPYQPFDNFMNLLMVADVMLDTNLFNGGSTSFQGLSVGTPIVTMPGELMRQRCTKFLYDILDVQDCIATTEQEYVDIAVRLANDRAWREDVSEHIKAKNHLLFEQTDGPKGWADFILNAAKEKLGFEMP